MLGYKIVDCDRIQGSHDYVIQEFHKSLKTQFLARIPFRAKYFRRKCPTSFLDNLYDQYNENISFSQYGMSHNVCDTRTSTLNPVP